MRKRAARLKLLHASYSSRIVEWHVQVAAQMHGHGRGNSVGQGSPLNFRLQVLPGIFQIDTVRPWMQPSQWDFGKRSSSHNWVCGLSCNDAAPPLQNYFLRPWWESSLIGFKRYISHHRCVHIDQVDNIPSKQVVCYVQSCGQAPLECTRRHWCMPGKLGAGTQTYVAYMASGQAQLVLVLTICSVYSHNLQLLRNRWTPISVFNVLGILSKPIA